MQRSLEFIGFMNPGLTTYMNSLRETIDWDSAYTGVEKYHVNYCGIEDCSPHHSFGPHKRSAFLIHVILHGKGEFQVNGETWTLHENQSFLIYPGDTYYYEADGNEPWHYLWIGFSGIDADECCVQMGFTRKKPVITLKSTDGLADCIENILTTHQLTFANELRRTSELTRFLAIMIEEQHKADPEKSIDKNPRSDYVQLVVDYIAANYMKELKISDLARQIGINRSYLTNSFTREMKLSPHEFLVKLRMEKAAVMLKDTNLTVNEISKHVGYYDPFAFSKMFKRYFMISPREFRNSAEIPG